MTTRKNEQRLNLAEVIDKLPAVDVDVTDLKVMLMKYLGELTADRTAGSHEYATKRNCQLRAIQQLAELVKEDAQKDMQSDVLKLLLVPAGKIAETEATDEDGE